ncbi:hypothetical protein H8E07_03085 [bacterium]|nr:hypothetical protein [bacterium]
MKRTFYLLAILAAMILIAAAANAQGFGPGEGQGEGVCNFIDEDGDGFNDLAPDADGDGIPNGLDPDYVRPGDGTGNQFGADHETGLFCRSFGEDAMGIMHRFGFSYGPGDGTGDGACPGDGSGFGPGSGTGEHNDNGHGNGGNLDGRHGRHNQ